MLLTGLCFVAVNVLVKFLGPRVPAPQAAFLRFLFGLVFLLPMWPVLRDLRPTARQWRLIAGRGVVHTGAVTLWFFAMTRIPLADVNAMNYMTPIYVTIGAALFLGETLATRRIIAIGVALVGALIILRPGFREIGPGHMAMLGSSVFFGASFLSGKLLADDLSPAVVVAALSLAVTIGMAPLAIMVWQPVTLHDGLLLFAVASCATLGHYTMTRAFKLAPVTITQPVTFLQLVWATLFGVFLFHEAVDGFVLLGGGIIIAAVSFITWREAKAKRRATTPPVPATKL
ncbi:Threonine/homoserine efflux transporter RhtA [Poseidonocella sedimentorum]|uniref:Threonine/homoserine efflux transporter RhtA n=2 Tax=Poseidonocella sedimentorum TaxID=871652 RepID=A0A1I6CSW5_9RHOB|nr:Threonine/homoserine efflux transporter RhtA [Poseidonocella sedimentorum]